MGAEIAEALQREGLEVEEELWEAHVESRRLNLAGRVDLLLLLEDGSAAVVEAKLAPSRRRLRRHPGVLPQLAAYAIAAEETTRRRVSRAYLYLLEPGRLLEVKLTPTHRS